MKRFFPQRTRVFTLIELLTVIAIIAILAALLLPACAKARSSAQAVDCRMKLRQIGVAALLYSEDFGGYIPPADFGGDVDSWINYFGSQLSGGENLFRCTALPTESCFDPYGGHGERFTRVAKATYVMNTVKRGAWGGAAISTAAADSCGWGDGTQKPVSLRSALHPSESIFILDGGPGLTSSDARGIVDFNETDHGEILGTRDAGWHHALGFNSVFGDGHVESIQRSRPDQWVVTVTAD